MTTFESGFLHRPLNSERGRYTWSEQELHDHYATRARIEGHAPDCEKITRPVNWPTLFGRPDCTCDHGDGA